MILETKRLLLRPLRMTDLDDLLTFWGNEEVMRYCGGAGDREREKRAIAYYQKLMQEKGYAPLAVVLKSEERVIGACGFQRAWEDDAVELIYHFAKAFWGKGYATEAVRAVVDHARTYPSARSIVAAVSPENRGSYRVLEKVGFQPTGKRYFEDTGQEEPTYRYILEEE